MKHRITGPAAGCLIGFLVLVKLALIAFLCFLAYVLVMHYAS